MEEEGSTPSFKESAEISAEIVVDSPTLRALLQGIGVVLGGPAGGIMAQWVVASMEQVQKQRLQQIALLLTHAHPRCVILAGKRCASVDAPVMGMVQLHCNPL